MPAKAPPVGYHSVTPNLVVNGAGELIDFMKSAFGARERMRMPAPDGRVAHAEMEIGDSPVMIADANDMFPATTGYLHVYVEDSDAMYKKALAAGARSLSEPQTMFYGDRAGNLMDKWGNRWTVSTHVEDVSEEELQKRMAAMR